MGDGLNSRAVNVFAPIFDHNEDYLCGFCLHDEINLSAFAGIILDGEFEALGQQMLGGWAFRSSSNQCRSHCEDVNLKQGAWARLQNASRCRYGTERIASYDESFRSLRA